MLYGGIGFGELLLWFALPTVIVIALVLLVVYLSALIVRHVFSKK